MTKHYHGNVSGSESSDSDDETDSSSNIKSLKADLTTNPSDYDGHIKLVNLCKDSGELTELRSARNNFAKAFPLTEKLWLDWIGDEKNVCQTEEEHEALVELFERAIEDYMCPDLWVEYITYAIRWLSAEGGLARFRTLCERAITAVGLHPSKGAQIYEVYRETESMLENEGKNDRIGSIFRRHVSVPIYAIDETYKELKTFNQKIWKEAKMSYDAAILKLKEIEPFEADLRQSDTPKGQAEVWQQYITYELKKADPVRIEFVYERATTQLCLDPALWIKYLNWARKIKSPNLTKIAKRATRNCGWEGELWTLRLKIQEEKSCSKSEIENVLTEALECLEACSISTYLSLWWQFILYHKRSLQMEASDDNKGTFRAAIKRAVKYFETSETLGEERHVHAREFECFAARIEATFCGEMTRARSKWEKIIKTSFGQDAANWSEYAQLEVQFGTVENARKIFRKGAQFSKFNNATLFEKASNFEKVYGNMQDIDELAAIISKKKNEIERREKREKTENEKAKQRQEKMAKNFDEKTKSKIRPMAFVKQIDEPGAPPVDPGAPSGPPPAKRPRNQNDDQKISESSNKSSQNGNPQSQFGGFKAPIALPNIAPVKPRPPKVKAPKEHTAKPVKAPNVNEPKYKHAETPEEKDRTVYVSNMDYRALQPENDIRKIFVGCGEIEEIRLIRKGILFRGYGYVLFKNKEGADNALLRDRTKINGRPAFVSKFSDKEADGQGKKDFKFNDGKEDHRVFVKHPNIDITQEQIHEIFEKCGTIVDVRLPETRQGYRKPFFYVEYASGLEAAKANLTMDGQMILGAKIEVKISDPPKRGQEAPKERKELDLSKTAYATPRSRFTNLVPRTVKTEKKPVKDSLAARLEALASGEPTGEKSEEKPKTGGMSNADFSKLFSK